MKKTLQYFLVISLAANLQSCFTAQPINTTVSYDQSVAPVTYQTFYDELSPYGSWIDYPGYGYVWSPNVPDFKPYYSNGYWVNTNLGWNWKSDYSWGWGPFHYGRWFYETGYGWLWIPGYDWAPAWVTWRNSNDYYGWAPMPPGMNVGGSGAIEIPSEHWNFVDHRHLDDRDFRSHAVEEDRNEDIYRSTTIINNNYRANDHVMYNSGPKRNEVAKYADHKIEPVTIREHQQIAPPQINNSTKEIKIYKPVVQPPVRQQQVQQNQHQNQQQNQQQFQHQNQQQNQQTQQQNQQQNQQQTKQINQQQQNQQTQQTKQQHQQPSQQQTQQQIPKPQKVVPYQNIPHDNGKRGTFTIPQQNPVNNKDHKGY